MNAAFHYSTFNNIRKEVQSIKDNVTDTQELLLEMSEEISKLSQDPRSVSITTKNARLGETVRAAHTDIKTRMREHIDRYKGGRGRAIHGKSKVG